MSDLQNRMDALYKKKVEGALEKRVRLTALSIFTEIVVNTPVGNPDLWESNTGRRIHGLTAKRPEGYVGGSARMSWNMDINVVDVKITEAKSAVEATFDGSEKGLAVVAKYKLSDTIYIANAIPYIVPLNNGHSSQAPAGFIDAAVQVGIQKGKELSAK